MNYIHAIIDDCANEMRRQLEEDFNTELLVHSSQCSFDTEDGYIDMYCGPNGNVATVEHNSYAKHNECRTLCEAIQKALPDFNSVRDSYYNNIVV